MRGERRGAKKLSLEVKGGRSDKVMKTAKRVTVEVEAMNEEWSCNL